MLRRNILHLLEPAAVAGPGEMTKSWIASLPSLTTPVDDGGGGDGGGEAPKGEDGKTPDAGGAAAPPGTGVAPKPDAATKPPTSASAPKPAPAAAAVPPKADEDERQPRNAADWKKFQEKRAAEKEELKAQIKEREEKLAKLEARAKELEEKANAPQADPAIAKEMEAIKKLNEELSSRIAVLDVTKDPRFETYFETKLQAAHEDIKSIVGEERGKAFIELLNLPEGEWKTNQINDFYSQLMPSELSELGAVRKELRGIERERAQEIQRANETKEKLLNERKAQAETLRTTYDQTIAVTVKDLTDPENGFAAYQKMPETEEGAAAWNASVDKRIAEAKARLMGKSTPAQIVRTAFDAAALPAVLESYQEEKAQWAAEKKTLEAQIAELTAARPANGAGGGSAKKADTTTTAKADDPPHVRAKKWAEDIGRRMNTPIEQ